MSDRIVNKAQSAFCASVLGLFCGLYGTTAALAQFSPEDSYANDLQPVEVSGQFEALGNDLMGDSLSHDRGTLSFYHVDVDLPGNSDLPVRFARRWTSNGVAYLGNQLGGWQIDVPFITTRQGIGRFSPGEPHHTTGGAYCFIDGFDMGGGIDFGEVAAYYQGFKMNVPGEGMKQLMVTPTGTAEVNFPYGNSTATTATTDDFWQVYCEEVGGNPTGAVIAISPGGDTYEFRTLSLTPAGIEWITSSSGPTRAGDTYQQARFTWHHNLLATRVTDRHGNTVEYDYGVDYQHRFLDTISGVKPDGYSVWTSRVTTHQDYFQYRLLAIRGDDGRRIDIQYNAPHATPANQGFVYTELTDEFLATTIQSVSANGRTWLFDYAHSGDDNYVYSYAHFLSHRVLRDVTLPDGRQWTLNLPIQHHKAQRSFNSFRCSAIDNTTLGIPWIQFWFDGIFVEHPSGARAEYDFDLIKNATYFTGALPVTTNNCPSIPKYIVSNAVTERRIIESAGATATWQYQYDEAAFTISGLGDVKRRIETRPDGTTVERLITIHSEGDLVRQTLSGGGVYQVNTTDYLKITEFQLLGDVGGLLSSDPRFVAPSLKRPIVETLTVDGETYQTDYTYNTNLASAAYSYGQPIQITRSSALSGTRTTDLTYIHDRSDWIIGLLDTVTRDGKLFDDLAYDGLGRLIQHNKFGALVANVSWHTSGPDRGSVHQITDALGRVTTLTDYERGVPTRIEYPDGSVTTRAVDPNGWITRITDPGGTAIYYSYNSVGWLTLIDLPAGFLDTTISYSGLGAGFTQTLTRGSMRTITEFDSFHRPERVERRAIWSGGGSIFTRTEYDAFGRVTFASFPSTNSNPTTGVTTTYDGLGRVTRTEENVSPFAATVTAYLTDNRTRVTDPSGNVTTTWASGYGGPGDGETIRIDHPLGLTTEMTYDAWGNLLTARQHGTHSGFSVDETQTWTYDSSLRLCRHTTPETSGVFYTYDNANQLITEARGVPPTNACGTAPIATQIIYGYDQMGRQTSINYPDASPDVTMGYDANGNLSSATRGISAWSYRYNAMNQLIEEELVVDGRIYETRYNYLGDGRHNTTRTPGNRLVEAQPDGHGRPRAAIVGSATYAFSGAYHPSGQLESLGFGGGLTYTASFNARQQMTDLIVARTGLSALDFSYNYDANGRVTSVTDHATPGENRTFSYDGLGRLTAATGPWGNASYSYDLLNNIRQKQLGVDTVEIEYGGANRISRARDTRDGNIWRDYSWGARGNLGTNGRLNFSYDRSDQPVAMSGIASGTFVYDAHNRRVKQTINGETIYSVYGLDGTLRYRDNITTGEVTDYIRLGRSGRTIVRLATTAGNTAATWVHTDHLGSSASATNVMGNLLWRESYTPFGETLNNPAANANDQGYTGHIQDTASGLTYMQARYYDPVIGRFHSSDTVGFADMGPAYFNRYSYSANDPVNHVDPTGQWIESAWDVANVAIGVASLVNNLSEGNFGAAAIDAVGVVLDGTATVIPLVPGGAGTAIRAGRAAGDVAEAVGDAARAGRGTCCFVAGTLVETENGLEPIESIELGDRVWARDTETGETALKEVTDLFIHERVIWEIALTGEDGASEFFETTDDHPWWIIDDEGRGNWVLTENLSPGMTVISRTDAGADRTMTIQSVTATGREDLTYNFTVADFNTYFVGENRVLVHNCPIDPGDVTRIDPDQISAPSPGSGRPPIGTDGHPIELHHTDGPNGPLVEMTQTDHRRGDNFQRNHPEGHPKLTLDERRQFNSDRRRYWREREPD